MPLNKNPLILAAKGAIVAWGMLSFAEGSRVSFFVNGLHQSRQTTLIELVYYSIFLAGIISFFSSRIAAWALCATTVAAVVLLLATNYLGHGPGDASFFLWGVAKRPGLGTVLLFLVSFWERRLGATKSASNRA